MAGERNYFTFIWRIENFNFAQSIIQSPSFVMESVKDNLWCFEQWCFELAPQSALRKDHITFHAKREGGDAFGVNVETSFSIDDSSSSLYEGFFGISPNMVFSSACYVPHNQIYVRKSGEFLAPETMTIRCRMYLSSGSFSEAGHCYARTRIRVQKTAFIGFLKNFSHMSPGMKYALEIKSSSSEDDLFALELGLVGDLCCKEKFSVNIYNFKEDDTLYCKCKLFLIDSNGTKTECARNEKIYSETESNEWGFVLRYTKGYLLRRKTQFLSNNSLTLKCEFAFSTGIEYEEIEDSEFGNLVIVNNSVSKPPSALEDFTCLYEEGILCDLKLRAENETFNAHKNVLSARSSVFKSMFTNHMKEKITECVTIEDLDANTVRRMLLYLYSDRLEDLDYEKAKSMYVAADKYNIASLKHICSDFLKSNLQLVNCIELLAVADMHQDPDLKRSVQEYIADNGEEIFRSDEWANFEKGNPKLSIE